MFLQELGSFGNLYFKTLKKISNHIWRGGSSVLEGDWDYLIILDACRFDIFKKINDIGGNLKKKVSVGSHTLEWAKRTFKQDTNIVYVTATPQMSEIILKKNLGFVPFHHIENVWDFDWDETLNTVLPEKVTEATEDAREKYPNKPLIIHYLQPHAPFIFGPRIGGIAGKRAIGKIKGEDQLPPGNTILELARNGFSKDQIFQGYIKNLVLVLEEVKKLIKGLDGKVIITSDHGQCFGELGVYGHPSGMRIPQLINVPWLEINKGEMGV